MHYAAMTHADLIKDAEAIAAHLGVSIHTVRSWKQRKSIPSEKWAGMIEGGFATLEQLSPAIAEVIRKDAA